MANKTLTPSYRPRNRRRDPAPTRGLCTCGPGTQILLPHTTRSQHLHHPPAGKCSKRKTQMPSTRQTPINRSAPAETKIQGVSHRTIHPHAPKDRLTPRTFVPERSHAGSPPPLTTVVVSLCRVGFIAFTFPAEQENPQPIRLGVSPCRTMTKWALRSHPCVALSSHLADESLLHQST